MRGGSRAARRDARRPITAASCPPSVPTERVGRRGRDSDLGQVARAAQEAPPPTGPPRAPDRAGPREALAACREGDTLVVTKLDRLARSLPDARDSADELTAATSSPASAARCTTPTTRSADSVTRCAAAESRLR